ncbi:MAG: hypothetical protein IKV96_02435, partial [Firmicutes bacterium]|nr:hypothetical protein [Bacillota bacterium]
NIIAPVVDGVAVCDVKDYSYKVNVSTLTAPVEAGVKGGTLTLYRNKVAIAEYDLYVMNEVPLSGIQKFIKWWKESVPGFFKVVIIVVVVAGLGYVTLLVLVNVLHKRKKKKRMEMKAQRQPRADE